MSKVEKLVIVDDKNKYLMMFRSAHPNFGIEPDLPGGTLEAGEEPLETMVREVYEEAGVTIDGASAQKLYEGTDYSAHKTQYSLYLVKLDHRPTVTMSWEHSSYEWLDREDFLEKARSANDTYIHKVYIDLTSSLASKPV
jgi:8-oxo-dGTP pyrophosphatase MutT (NUDIX family)